MNIIQFRATDPDDIQAAIGAMLVTVNGWSLLDFRARNDADQVTQPWGPDAFSQHAEDPELWWANWSQVYPHLGEIGRGLADLNIGTPDNLGILIGSPLGARDITLHLLDVADLVAAGYVMPQDTLEV
jgi:hypothetical protein